MHIIFPRNFDVILFCFLSEIEFGFRCVKKNLIDRFESWIYSRSWIYYTSLHNDTEFPVDLTAYVNNSEWDLLSVTLKKHSNILLLRWSAPGHHLRTSHPEEDLLLPLQHHRAVRHAVGLDIADLLASAHFRWKDNSWTLGVSRLLHVYVADCWGGSGNVRVCSIDW